MPDFDRPSNVLPFRAKDSAIAKLDGAVEIRNATDTTAEVWLTGEVGWDIYAPYVIEQLKALDGEGKAVKIFLNSPGGDVFEGYAIANFIAGMKATTEVEVVALAASIASLIAVSADKVSMPSNSMMMIHEAWAFAMGTADELDGTATLLRKMNGQLATAYERKRLATLGTDEGEDFAGLMSATSWFTAEEAVALGLADEILGPVRAAACVRLDVLDRLAAPDAVRALVVETAEEDPATAAPEPEDDTAADDAEEAAKIAAEAILAAEIRATCAALNANDRADEFIAARTSPADVRAALWAARAAADAAIETDTTLPVVSEPDPQAAYPERADQIRNKYAAALR